jgi:SAM-dependent methyltransferase
MRPIEGLVGPGPGAPPREGGRVERCAACGAGELRPHFEVRGEMGSAGLIPTTKEFGTALGDIVRCHDCGHLQLDVFPSEAELAGAYAEAASDDYVEEEAGQRESARRMLAKVERHVSPGRLLDVGPWVGFYMAEAEARGWKATGVEPSTFASAYARDRLGLDVRTDDLFAIELPEDAFDAVLLGDVLEHLTRTDEALARVKRWLAPEGALVLLLPDAGSLVARLLGRRWWSVIPTHVHYFTRGSVERLLSRHGLRVVHFSTDPKAFTVRYYLNKIGGYSPRLSRALVRAAEGARLAERMWAPDFRDRMVVVAKPKKAPAGHT